MQCGAFVFFKGSRCILRTMPKPFKLGMDWVADSAPASPFLIIEDCYSTKCQEDRAARALDLYRRFVPAEARG